LKLIDHYIGFKHKCWQRLCKDKEVFVNITHALEKRRVLAKSGSFCHGRV
jgi:hypothetical protein